MRLWIFRKFEQLIEAAITRRIVVFHDALVSRGELNTARCTEGYSSESGPFLPPCGQSRHSGSHEHEHA